MKISIFGLGYVGCVSLGCLGSMGYSVIGVDINQSKVDLVNEGKPTIVEDGIAELITQGKNLGLIRATVDPFDAVMNSDLTYIAVGTPSSETGHLDLSYIFKVAEQIADALVHKQNFHVIAIRSTVLPGTNKKVVGIIEKHSGKVNGLDFAVVSNPEFLREGTAVKDFFNPPLTVIGSDNVKAKMILHDIYSKFPAEIVETDIEVAEIIKYVNNTFHALKVVFGNEIGNICKKLNIDSHDVMRIFCMDTQLNISSYYLKPGFAYGGSCLPKDTKALKTLASDLYVETPIINNIERSNEIHKQNALNLIMSKNKRKVGILGLSFKPGTDDLRNSPIVDVVERLLGKGYEIKIYDKNVKVSELTGANKEYIDSKVPHLQHLITEKLNDVINNSEVLVIANKEAEFEKLDLEDKVIVDLVRIWNEIDHIKNYEGICW